MYSQPLPDQQVYSILEIRYNENKLLAFPHTWEEPRKVIFTNTSWLFMNLQSKGPDYVKDHYINSWLPQHPFFEKLFKGFKNYNDVDELEKFPLWLKRYLEQETGETIYKIDLYKVNVAFEQSGSVNKISSTLVHTIK
jgi:protein gp37